MASWGTQDELVPFAAQAAVVPAIAAAGMCFGTETPTGAMQRGAPCSTVGHESVSYFRQKRDKERGRKRADNDGN